MVTLRFVKYMATMYVAFIFLSIVILENGRVTENICILCINYIPYIHYGCEIVSLFIWM